MEISLVIVFIVSISFIIFFFLSKFVFEDIKNDADIDVIILSYNRPHNLKKSLPILSSYQKINNIYIYHGNSKKYDPTVQHYKVKHVKDFKNDEKMKTLTRFYHTLKIKSKYTLILDDDVIPSNKLIQKMLQKSKEDKTICVGNMKRLCTKDGYFFPKDNDDEYNTILTPILFSRTEVFQRVWKQMIKEKTFFDLVLKQNGNCEDLLFNYTYRKVYKKNAYHVSGKYTTLDTSNGFSTTNSKEHNKIRNNFCKLLYS